MYCCFMVMDILLRKHSVCPTTPRTLCFQLYLYNGDLSCFILAGKLYCGHCHGTGRAMVLLRWEFKKALILCSKFT